MPRVPKYRELTEEEKAALVQVRAVHGRCWKSKLRINWMYVEYDDYPEISNVLQTLRNQLGPNWLVNYKGEKDAALSNS